MAKHYSLERIVGFHFLGTESIYGLPTRVFSRLVIGYMVLAVAFTSTGAADFFFKFCLALLGHIRGGAAKVSILSSAFFAMMSGSAVANVVTTGAFTIPTMKRLGYPDYYAAAIDACAYKGGTLSPPVIGITAFIMADFIGVSYTQVCIAASLVSLGIHEMSAHLFLVYWGSVSFITPPVALAAYAAASLAGANPMKTGFQAVRLGFVSLLIPFFFVYNPALVAHGTLLEIFTTMATAIVGIILLSAGFEAYCFWLRSINIPVRILFMGAGFVLFSPIASLKGIGLALIIVGIALHFGARKVEVARQPKAEQG